MNATATATKRVTDTAKRERNKLAKSEMWMELAAVEHVQDQQ